MRPLIALSALLFASSAAAVECRLDGTAFILGRAGAAAPPARVADARIGEPVTAWVVAPGRLDGRRVLFSDAPGPRFVPFARCGKPVRVEWRRVEPEMEHVDTPSPNKDIDAYANAVVFGPRHGEWLGFDAIEYFESPLDGDAPSITLTGAHPSDPELDVHEGLGAMRLAATLNAFGRLVRTPGADDHDGPGLKDQVFRYTFRRGDDFIGWLTSFFQVPYLFGSAGHRERAQAERYVGADCADILVAALRRAGRRDLDYSSVSGLISVGKKVAGPVDVAEGPVQAGPRLRFGADVRPGDLLIIDYVGWDGSPRAWDHILALVADRGPGGGPPDGLLGPEDLVADSGDARGLVFQPLGKQGHVKVVVVRIGERPRS